MWRALVSRTWLPRIVFGIVLVLVFVRLGLWQLDRYEQRSEQTAVVQSHSGVAPVPLDEVLADPSTPLAAGDEWTVVQVTGRYAPEQRLQLRLRPVEGNRGVHDLVPLVLPDGAAVLVDRGFLPTAAGDDPVAPPTPDGEVDLELRVRADEDGAGLGGSVSSGSIRNVDLAPLAQELGIPLYDAWGEVLTETPDGRDGLMALPGPETDLGPHLSYAIQWFLFGVVGIVGFIVLFRGETRPRREEDDEHDDDTDPDPAGADADLGTGGREPVR